MNLRALTIGWHIFLISDLILLGKILGTNFLHFVQKASYFLVCFEIFNITPMAAIEKIRADPP